MKKLLAVMAIFLVAAVVAFPPAAQATATLWLSDGVNPVVIVPDQAVGLDSNPVVGAVTYVGGLGAWIVDVTTGITYPALGSPSAPEMDLSHVSVSSGGPATLTIMFSEVDFNLLGVNPVIMAIGGTTVGTVQYATYYDIDNDLFALTTLIDSLGPYAPLAFSGSTTGEVDAECAYSLTQVVTITQEGAGASSFDGTLQVVPVPPSVWLFGSGLLGLIGLRRKLFR
jgi:hypothetical protein